MTRTIRAPLSILPLIAVLAACSSGAAPFPLGSPAASPPAASAAAVPVTSAAEAAAAVIATDPRFAGLGAQDPNLIGQCCFYQVQGTDTGYTVTIEIGWGDCPAGCINRHRWAFTVTLGGDVTLIGEQGPPLPAGVPGGGAGTGGASSPPPPGSSAGVGSGGGITIRIGIAGVALAGPTCPVVQPNDPNCADRPVPAATIHVFAADGVEVATLETDAQGRFAVELEPGSYRVVADAVAGYMHEPEPVTVTVSTRAETVQLLYDTGIR
jgi:Carboxypeptidase regulatory-like domain